jgi:hypothetical protein
MGSNMKVKALDRASRLRQIMLAFAVNVQSGRGGEMTLTDIARAIDYSVSTKLRDMVRELEIVGVLTHRIEPMPGVVGKRYIYYPTASFDVRHGSPVKELHTIRINAKRNGQRALWNEVLT